MAKCNQLTYLPFKGLNFLKTFGGKVKLEKFGFSDSL